MRGVLIPFVHEKRESTLEKKMRKKFEHEKNDKAKKLNVCLFTCDSI